MRLLSCLVLSAAAILFGAVEAGAAPGFRYIPLPQVAAMGSFTPVTLTDSEKLVGTIALPSGGSLMLESDGSTTSTADFCGTRGAADNTMVASTSPFSDRKYMQGYCGGSYFVRDVRKGVTSFPPPPPKSIGPTLFNGVMDDGWVWGFCCVHGGGGIVYDEKRGGYSWLFGGGPNRQLNAPFLQHLGIADHDTIYTTSAQEGVSTVYGFVSTASKSVYVLYPTAYPECEQTTLLGANSSGEALGYYSLVQIGSYCPSQSATAFYLTRSGQYILPPSPLNTAATTFTAMNESGDVSGKTQTASGGSAGFVWHTSTGQITYLVPPAGALDVSPVLINNHGDVAGWIDTPNGSIPLIARCSGAGCR